MAILIELWVVSLWLIFIQATDLSDRNWISIPGPEDAALESITVSSNHLWGIDISPVMGSSDVNVVHCRRPCSIANNWKKDSGRLEGTIDANEEEVWGVNDRGQVYKRSVDGNGDWVQITGGAHAACGPTCFSNVSVSNNEYIWATSGQNMTYMLCRGGVSSGCGNRDQVLIDDELSLVHIEAGEEEVWGVNASNHIFKRPVDGSGNWSIVPGRMRFISASGNEHIWGIAPNNSLYVCAKPCTGDWEYVGGCFKQIDGGDNYAIGVTTDKKIFAICMEGASSITECPITPTTSSTGVPSATTYSRTDPAAVTIIAALGGVIGLILLLFIVSAAVIFALSKMLRKSHIRDTRVKFISSQEGYLATEDGSGGFDNRVYSNHDSTSDPEYDSIDDANSNNSTDNNVISKVLGHDTQSKSQVDGAEDFRNRRDSKPNVYTLERSTNLSTQNTLINDQSGMPSPAFNEATDIYECDGSIQNDILTMSDQGSFNGENKGYDYANEKEFWEPATQEMELKEQVEKLIGVPLINREALRTHEQLGSGQFGTVYKGVWQHSDSEDAIVEVAVKLMKNEASEDERVKFLQEAAVMGQFNKHPYIIKILGITLDPPYKIVTELMHRGDLHNYLATLRPDPDQPTPCELGPTLLNYTRQVALGLMYLGFKKYVHRDIAARNILVNNEGICKIADFGLSRDLSDEDYYVSHGGKVPVKWTAPEAINYRKYSMASDVWSYGCLLYEIWSLGVKPFHDVSNKQAIEKIDSGYRLPPPPGCPKAVYQIMIKCWHPSAASRPTPCSVVTRLSHPDFQILKWSQQDVNATSERARTLGAPLIEGHTLYKGLQQTYDVTPNEISN